MSKDNLYVKIEPANALPIRPCPVCGSAGELWQYENRANATFQKAVMCTNGDAIGPQDGEFNVGCLLYMPPDQFYQSRIIEAVNYWNEYAEALQALRSIDTAVGSVIGGTDRTTSGGIGQP